MTPSSASGPWRTALFAVATGALLAAAGCAGSKAATSTPSASLSLAPAPTSSASAGQRAPAPGVSGLIAAIDKATLQVQDGTGQTAVTYNGKTTFTQSVPASLADVTVGSCVAVTSADPGGSAAASPDPSAPVTAGRVTISSPVGGTCAGGFGGGQGFPGGGAGTGRRGSGGPNGSGAPAGSGNPGGARPSGAPGGAFRGANGQVTAVTATGFVVKNVFRPGGSAGSSTSASASAVPASTTVTVTLTTVLTKPKAATAAALKVGECVTALGATDSTGAVTATAISIRAADANGCGQRRTVPSGGATNG
jgi:hypothetical protein